LGRILAVVDVILEDPSSLLRPIPTVLFAFLDDPLLSRGVLVIHLLFIVVLSTALFLGRGLDWSVSSAAASDSSRERLSSEEELGSRSMSAKDSERFESPTLSGAFKLFARLGRFESVMIMAPEVHNRTTKSG
jgi:hypothetical protein